MKVLEKLQAYLKQRQFRKFSERNRWQGLVPGDIVKYKNQEFIYLGLNKQGGPGRYGFPEPVFSVADAKKRIIYYLRSISEVSLLKEVFGENAGPSQYGSSGIAIGFLNTDRSGLKKVRHITPEQWDALATN